VPWSSNTEKLIAASLSPARVTEVELVDEEKRAIVSVPEDQQSLAIGKEGQNARLANKLTNWRIDIKAGASFFTDGAEEGGERSDKKSAKKAVGIWDKAISKQKKDKKEKEDKEEVAKEQIEPVENVDVQLPNE